MNSICKKVSFALTACACAVLAGCGATTGGGVKTQDTAAAAPATTNTTVRADGYHTDWSVARNVLAAGGINLDIQEAEINEDGTINKPLQGNMPTQPFGLTWLPTDQIPSYEAGAIWLQQKLANAMADGLSTQKFNTAYGLGVKSHADNRPWVRGAAIVFFNPEQGCPKPPKNATGKLPGSGYCMMIMSTADIAEPELATNLPAWMDKSTPSVWRYSNIPVKFSMPSNVKINIPNLLHSVAQQLPNSIFFYIPHVQISEKLITPILLDKKNAFLFSAPKNK